MTTSTQLPTGTWQIDPSATTVTVSAQHLGFSTVPATLPVSSGTVDVDGEHRVVATDVQVDAASYTSKNAKRNEHIRSKDFLDAETHPTITFHAAGVTPTGNGYTARGTVTVKGTTTPIDVAITSVDVSGDRATFTASPTIERNTLGVDKMPRFVVGNALTLNVAATVRRAP
jgi:polyisoprenoid-binding protein YceI